MPNRELFESRLTAFKERLLDLSGRNRMIHSNFQARSRLHFRFIDEVPNQLYEKLTSSKMDFTLPEPEETPKDEESSEFKSALEIEMLSMKIIWRVLRVSKPMRVIISIRMQKLH